MRRFLLFSVFSVMISCKDSKNESITPKAVASTAINNTVIDAEDALEIYDFEGFKKFLNKKDDKTYVINFWATWCGPCVKELPYFEKLTENYSAKGVEVILVSLDFPHMYETKLKPFIKKRNLKSKIIVLNDPSENKWINEIDANWSGSIPATIMYNSKHRKFFERTFTYDELEKEVQQIK